MNERQQMILKKVLKFTLITIGVLAGIFVLFKISVYFVPFIIAFVVSSLIEPIIRLLTQKARLKRQPAAAISLLLVISTVGCLLFLLISKLVSEIVSLSEMLPGMYPQIEKNVNMLINRATTLYHWLPPEVSGNIPTLAANLSSSLAKILNSFGQGVFLTAISLPETLVFVLVTILSTYFLASDRDRVYGFFSSQLPDQWVKKIVSIKNDLFSALFGYIRAQLIMMTITFTELSIGFFIIGIKYFMLLALVVAIIDALPILGTGGVLIPWAIFELITQDFKTGFALLGLYLFVLVVRQMIEPKVLSQQIGVHPLLTLTAMYTGLQLLGVGGLILGPITVLLLRNILSGIFKNRTFADMLNKSKTPANNN